MTHTIHRYGKPEDLERDYTIIFFPSRGVNYEQSQEKLRTFLRLADAHGAVNYGNMEAGSKLVIGGDKAVEAVKDGTSVQAVFKSKEDTLGILQELVKRDMGISVILQGLEERVKECCRHVGRDPHTWNHSLGIWGRTDLLPPPEVMEVTTMCGHGLVAPGLVNHTVDRLRRSKTTMEKAVKRLVKPCICGIINPVRVEEILGRLLESRA
jgi:hypothetical protein